MAKEAVNVLERADYEASMAKSNAEFMLERKGNEEGFLSGALWIGLCEERLKKTTMFERLKKRAEEDYVPDFLKGHEISWNITYGGDEMDIKVLCECGEKLCAEYGI